MSPTFSEDPAACPQKSGCLGAVTNAAVGDELGVHLTPPDFYL